MLEGSRWTTAQNRWTERLEALGSKITRQFNHPYFRHTSFLCCCKYTKSIILPVSEQGTRNHSPLASLLPKTFTLGWFDLFFLLHLPQMCVCVFMPSPFLTSLHTHTGLHSASVFLCTCQGRDCTGAHVLYHHEWGRFQNQAAMCSLCVSGSLGKESRWRGRCQ